jgi:hypothetical protein
MYLQFPMRLFNSRHRVTVAVVLLAQIVAATGVPLPIVAKPTKDRSTPYPCMDNPCGCSSAEECWRSCHCYTARQRLEWAEDHGIEPPSYLREAAAREPVERSIVGDCPHCKSKKSTKSCCTDACTPTPAGQESPRDIKLVFVLGIKAQSCGGHGVAALLTQAWAPPCKVTSFCSIRPVQIDTLIPTSWSANSRSDDPTTPPPRSI